MPRSPSDSARKGTVPRAPSPRGEASQEKRRAELEKRLEVMASKLTEKTRSVRKITHELIEAESRLRQSERLAWAGQMASMFAHEIGSPLSSLGAHAELLLEDPKLAPPHRESVAIMNKQIARLGQIVEDLLRLARRGPEDFVPLDIAGTVEEVLELVAPRLRAKNIHASVDLGRGLVVRGFQHYLQEVFLNVINNATDAMENEGEIRIAGGTEGPMVWVEIGDTGPGIAPAILEKLGTPFSTTKAFGRGTGLGLAVAQEITEQHRGSMTVRSGPEGTVVRITLPLAEGERGLEP